MEILLKTEDTDGKLANAVITINGEKYISGLNMDNFFNVTAYAKDGLTSGEKETFIIVPYKLRRMETKENQVFGVR